MLYINQVAGHPQAVQINLLRHQHTELPAGKYKKKDHLESQSNQTTSSKAVRIIKHKPKTRRGLTPRVHKTKRTDVPNVVIQLT